MNLRVSGLIPNSIVDGTGVRFVVFVQGCMRACPGCHNPQTQPLDGGYELDTDVIFEQIKKESAVIKGVTFSGGEPFLQPEPLAELASKIKSAGLDLWCYSGFTFERLSGTYTLGVPELLRQLDVLVDGAFIKKLVDPNLNFRGSSNQRIIDVQETFKQSTIILKNLDNYIRIRRNVGRSKENSGVRKQI